MSWEHLMWAVGYGWMLGCTSFAMYLFYRYTQLPEIQGRSHRLVILAFMPVAVAGLGAMAWAVYLSGGFRGIGYVLAAFFAASAALSLSLYGFKLGIARKATANEKE